MLRSALEGEQSALFEDSDPRGLVVCAAEGSGRWE
jgi:hypothetical protein